MWLRTPNKLTIALTAAAQIGIQTMVSSLFQGSRSL
jgi:hypothetical protein